MRKFFGVLLLVLLSAGWSVGQTTTPNLGLTKPAQGATNWHLPMNGNFDIIDGAVGFAASHFSSGSNTCGIAEAYAAMPSTGARLTFDIASCTISSAQTVTLTAGKPLNIEGMGKKISLSHTTGTGLTFTTGVGFGRLTMRNLTITYTGAGTAPNGIVIQNVVNAHIEDVSFNGFPATGGVQFDLNNTMDSTFLEINFAQAQGYTALKLENNANNNFFASCAFQGAANAAILITNASAGNTFYTPLVQSNSALKAVQLTASTGDGNNIAYNTFVNGWFENNGDITANTHVVELHADTGFTVLNTVFIANHFVAKAAANFAYGWSGTGALSYLSLMGNQYGTFTSTMSGFPNGAAVAAVGENGNNTYQAGLASVGPTNAVHGAGIIFAPAGATKTFQIYGGYPTQNDSTFVIKAVTDNKNAATYTGATGWTLDGFVLTPKLYANGATASGGAGQLIFGNTSGFGNGSAGQTVTTTLKSTGTGPTTPQTVVKYLKINLDGADYWVPLVQ